MGQDIREDNDNRRTEHSPSPADLQAEWEILAADWVAHLFSWSGKLPSDDEDTVTTQPTRQ